MLSNANMLTNIIWATLESLLILGAGVKFFFSINARLKNMENYTYKRNGGGSIADSQARIELLLARQDETIKENTRLTFETAKAVAKLEGRLDNHLEESKK